MIRNSLICPVAQICATGATAFAGNYAILHSLFFKLLYELSDELNAPLIFTESQFSRFAITDFNQLRKLQHLFRRFRPKHWKPECKKALWNKISLCTAPSYSSPDLSPFSGLGIQCRNI